MKVVPMSDAVGAEIRGVDLSTPLSAAEFDQLHRAWLDHLVLVFRQQVLDNDQLQDFSSRFGTLEDAPLDKDGRMFVDRCPKLLIISNVEENGRRIGGLANDEAVWHTDMSYNDVPPKASALYAREVPGAGGDTGFLNMYLALEALPGELRQRLMELRIKHDSTHNSVGHLRFGMSAPTDLTASPGAIHPAVRTHPESGRPALFLGRRPNAYVMGLPVEESEVLLDQLWAHCEQARFYWHHRWQVGDLVLWDNRCVMHRRDGFDNRERRVMYRTQIAGDRRPYLKHRAA